MSKSWRVTALLLLLKDWIPLLALVVAIAAALIALWNVHKTIRMNVMTREEDRIERALPGLVDATQLLASVTTALQDRADTDDARAALKRAGIAEDEIKETIDKLLPITERHTNHAIAQALSTVVNRDKEHRAALSQHSDRVGYNAMYPQNSKSRQARDEQERQAAAAIIAAKERLNGATHQLLDLKRDLDRKTASYLARLPRLRNAIEGFFDEG